MLPHRHRLPNPPPTTPLPLLVLIHGWLGNENVMWVFEKTFPPNVVIVAPRAPLAAEGGYGWFLDRTREAEDLQVGVDALHAFIQALPAQYPVDLEHLYLMGFSQGAALAYAYTLQHPQPVRALAALAGYLPVPARAWATPGRLVGKPVFITHGTQDEVLPVEAAQKAREAMVGAGATVEYHEHPTGHKLNAQGMRDLTRWWAQVRAST